MLVASVPWIIFQYRKNNLTGIAEERINFFIILEVCKSISTF